MLGIRSCHGRCDETAMNTLCPRPDFINGNRGNTTNQHVVEHTNRHTPYATACDIYRIQSDAAPFATLWACDAPHNWGTSSPTTPKRMERSRHSQQPPRGTAGTGQEFRPSPWTRRNRLQPEGLNAVTVVLPPQQWRTLIANVAAL